MAQQTPALEVQRQIDNTFSQVLADPRNLDTGYRYAHLLIDAGNFEGGIGALERMLLDPAAAPSIRLELGFLYYRLGSYAMAESYAQAAADDPRLDESDRQTARRLAADAAAHATGSSLSGSLGFGLRGQSNATAGPNSTLIRSGGALIQAPANTLPRADGDVAVTGDVRHVWDFGTQNSAALVSTLAGFANHFFSAASYDTRPGKTAPRDLFLLEGTSGVRFMPAPIDAPTLNLRPYLILTNLLLDGNEYFGGYGGGIDGEYAFADGKWVIQPAFEVRQYEYASRSDVFQSSAQSGQERLLRVRAIHELVPNQLVIGDVILRDHDAQFAFYGYRSWETRFSYLLNHVDPLGWDERLWTTTLYAGPLQRFYGAADPSVNPSVKLRDTEWRVGVTNLAPLTDTWSLLVKLEYTNADANIPNYSYNDVSGYLGVVWSF